MEAEAGGSLLVRSHRGLHGKFQARENYSVGPCPEKKYRKKEKETCMDAREERVLFISERTATAMQISPVVWQSKGTLQSFLSRSLVL